MLHVTLTNNKSPLKHQELNINSRVKMKLAFNSELHPKNVIDFWDATLFSRNTVITGGTQS